MKTIYNLEDLLHEPTIEIGSVISSTYETAAIITNDAKIEKANGLPLHSFLLAARHDEDNNVKEVVLLSVKAPMALESDRQYQNLREDRARTGKTESDARTKEYLQTLGFQTEILGTFYKADGEISFGGDVDRVRGNANFRVYKPQGIALSLIASYSRSTNNEELDILRVGRVRYTETEESVDDEASMFINVKDFIGKKTAVFGTTRSGKSNTIKTIAKKVFEYSHNPGKESVGQIIFDPQGEYANPNSQDGNSALAEIGDAGEVFIYKMLTEKESETDKLKHLQFNFFDFANANLFNSMMVQELQNSISSSSNYIAGLETLRFTVPNKKFHSDDEYAKNALKLLGFYALVGNSLSEVYALRESLHIKIGSKAPEIKDAFEELKETNEGSGIIEVHTIEAARHLFDWILASESLLEKSLRRELDKGGVLNVFKEQIFAQKEGKNGVSAAFRRTMPLHNDSALGDVREKIWHDLKAGRLVIVDLSKGSSRTTTNLSELIVRYLVGKASANFTHGNPNIKFQIVVEEAHNLFSRDGQKDDSDPWVRLSKEASKYGIGLVYATQEVSSVDPQILSNTSNWVVAHLNSRKELKELGKYYHFDDWASHLLRVETRGFVRLKTESSPFIVPVQIDLFKAVDDVSDFPEFDPQPLKAEASSPDDQPFTDEEDFNAIPF